MTREEQAAMWEWACSLPVRDRIGKAARASVYDQQTVDIGEIVTAWRQHLERPTMTCQCGCGKRAVYRVKGVSDLGAYDEGACEASKEYLEEAAAEFGLPFEATKLEGK